MKRIDKDELHSIFIEIRNNNESEFNRLYEEYKSLVYGVAFSILKNKEDSEEVMQNVFMKIFKMEKEKLPKESEASWLYTFSKNTALNLLRTKKEEIDIDDVYYIIDENDELNKVVDKDEYNRIISKLKQKDQEIVSLKILSGLSFKQISQILNIPIGTVQWKYYKSLHTLKTLLSSLSVYIATIIAFAIQRGNKTKKVILQENQTKDEDDEEKIQEATSKDEKKETDNIKNETNDVRNRTRRIHNYRAQYYYKYNMDRYRTYWCFKYIFNYYFNIFNYFYKKTTKSKEKSV